MSQTSRLGLPFIEPGQAQKELYHNESLRIIDVAVAAAVETVGANAPPASPVEGQCFIVGPAPTGAWSGQAGAIAGYAAGGWRFAGPLAGMRALDKASGQTACHDGAEWVVGTIKGATLEWRAHRSSVRGLRRWPIRAVVQALMSKRERRLSRSSTGCVVTG